MEKILNKIEVSPYGKIRVVWEDKSENYSIEAKHKIRNYFATKYGLPKESIFIDFKPIKVNKNGDRVEIEGSGIENIMDVNYQHQLMKQWLEREEKTDIDFDRIIKLDDKVNGELSSEFKEVRTNKKWGIKWLMIDNFLSFGENNFVSLNKLKGLTIVNSLPENTGGKTSFSVDSFKFLLFGTTTKTDKNEEIFNQFSDKNELTVRGCVEIDEKEFIIERKMKRSAKKAGGWSITNKLNYYEILPDGEEQLMNDEDATKTTKTIEKTIGNEKDFELITLATADTLENLIKIGATENGKILSRFIGLEVIEKKEEIVREQYNKFTKTMKSNQYNTVTLNEEIKQHELNIVNDSETKLNKEKELELTKEEIINLNNEKEKLFNSKQNVEDEIKTLSPEKLEKEIKEITDKGLTYKAKIEEVNIKLVEIGIIEFDEIKHDSLTKEYNKNNTDVAVKEAEIKRLNKTISDLKSGEICTACNRKLDDVDNTEHIKKHEDNIITLNTNITKLKERNVVITNELITLNEIKKKVDNKNKLELERDRAEVEIGSLRNKIKEKQNDLKKYNLNISAIDFNKNVDGQIEIVKTKINTENYKKDTLIVEIEKLYQSVKSNTEAIGIKNGLVETIEKEEVVNKIYKIYIEMFGKKGIGKLVLRSVLPIINSEIKRLLEGVCDFDVEVFVDEKNEVQYLIIKEGIEKLLKSGSGFEKTASALALRCVLGKMSNLPMPNFITFDEIWGKVADVNIELFKPLFEKIRNMYSVIFIITHNGLVQDFADNIITVVKENDISRLSIK